MKAQELRELAIDWLARTYPDSLIVPELSIGTWGSALLDVAAVTETEIIGVEIKGEGDSPARMPLQAAIYSKAATRMFFLPCPELEARCFKHLPADWGKLIVREGRIEESLSDHQKWVRDNEAFSRLHGYDLCAAKRLCVAPGQLLQCLWRDELDTLARLQAVITGKCDVETLRRKLADGLPLNVLVPETCAALRRRRWNSDRGKKLTIWASERLAA